MSDATTPILTLDGPRATIRFNRPAVHNRIEPPDLHALLAHFAAVEADPAIRVLVVTGTGASFSSGYHLGDLESRPEAEVTGEVSFEAMLERLERLRVPTVAALNGGVYGGSTDLALCCDFRVGVAGMRLRMPAAALGLHYYPSGMVRYCSRLGLNAAKRLFLLAEFVPAEELLAMGYLTELVADQAALDARADALAARLAAMAPLAVQGIKRSLDEIARGAFDAEAALARAKASQASADLREGLAAFREKRSPVFTGR